MSVEEYEQLTTFVNSLPYGVTVSGYIHWLIKEALKNQPINKEQEANVVRVP